ncbi:Major royal jelly protein [Arachidicoccus rhizosphaerae]|uniref:Major royal jelly protein n=1 Tax=Arachidicoccus rhizosphaerae TaxID=551991 RepID=A0A1H3YEF9_9BACT|nr:L-dopachrome tautomerase-related protein [Arachidicoccus rhizosphaerae]SEA09481.1 Major royal jelly protein [Arachidicoccus rhizosphaerae]
MRNLIKDQSVRIKVAKVVFMYGLFILSVSLLQAQSKSENVLEPVASFGKHMAIGLSVNSKNSIFVSFPGYDGAGDNALLEVENGKRKPYPDKVWNTKGLQGNKKGHFVRIQDLYVDNQDNLWVLDSKPAPDGDIFKSASSHDKTGHFALIKINTKTKQVERVYDFQGLDKAHSALNDVRVDTKKQMAYLSDPGQAAIVVLDLRSGNLRTVLTKSPFTVAGDIVLKYDGKDMVDQNGHPFSSDVNGIALTRDGKYFYFKPINKNALFRIETRYLTDSTLSESALAAKVENMGDVGVTHGLIADDNGNIYLTNSETYSIRYLRPDGQIRVLVKDKNLLWPDSMGIGGDGYLYISCSQLQRQPAWNKGIDKTEYPYTAFRVKLPLP